MNTGWKRRRKRGTTMAEMPLALWIIVMLCFSMMMVATLTLRFGFFWNACRESAQQAAKCQTFSQDTALGLSSCSTATQWSAQAAGAFTGLTTTQVNVYILQTAVVGGTQIRNPNRTPLAAAADPDNNIYDIQVEMIGSIAPLINFAAPGWLPTIPGLNAPFPVVVRSQYSSEVTQGLNK